MSEHPAHGPPSGSTRISRPARARRCSDALCAEASDCTGRLFYHLAVSGERYLWDTRLVGNGDYTLTIRAYDISGNEGERTVPLTVRN